MEPGNRTRRALCLVFTALLAVDLPAAEVAVKVIAHPSRAANLSLADLRAIYLKQKVLWEDGVTIVPINLEASSPTRELFSKKVFGQGSRGLAAYWNQRYFEAGVFPPATLASEEAVQRFVAGNRDAIGYVTTENVGESVAVVLVLP